MLNKTKSRQINLVKYALLIPVVLGMLMYTSCSSDNATSVIDVAEESNLQQYSYTVEKEVEITEDAKRIQKNAENFLKANNKDYVYWGIRDNVTGGANYFVRKATEKDPDGINKIELTFKDGGFFIMFLEKGLYPTHLDNIEKMNSFPSSKNLLAEKGWVSFNRIDTVPVFPGCESLTNNEGGKTCFQEGISNLFLKHFNRKIGKEAGLKGDVKIYVFFVISKEGEIIEVNARAPHDKLVDEALRVMSYAPKMIPGEENGEKVNVAYYIPVKFTINE